MAEDFLPILTRFHREVVVPDLKRIVGEAFDAFEQRINRRFDQITGPEAGRRTLSDYHINIFWSEEDGGYIADMPDLVSCSAFGASPAEALAQLELARQAWIEAARAEGKPIPAPAYRPRTHKAS